MKNTTEEIQGLLTQLEYEPQLSKLEYLTLEIWKTLLSNKGYLPTAGIDKAVELARYMISECNKCE